jgi:phage terminase large subunit-like protein
MKQSMYARRQPLLFAITTNGFVRECIFDSQYEYACSVLDGAIKDDRFLPFIYELDEREEWKDPAAWIKANPGLGSIKKAKMLEENVEKAKNDPAFYPTVMVKDFNMKENSDSDWLPYDAVVNDERCEWEKGAFRYAIGCFDASETTDLTAAKVLALKRGEDKLYVKSMYWLPETVLTSVDKTGIRRERDNVPYRLWHRQGLLRVTPGNKINKRCILDWFKELRSEFGLYVTWIGFDIWHIDESILEDFRREFGKNSMIPVIQGAKTLSDPMKSLKGDLLAKKVVHNNNPIDQWNLTNVQVRVDVNANIQPVKGLDTRRRIDGAVALIIGYTVLLNKMNEYKSLLKWW